MIGRLSGTLAYVGQDKIILDVNGVGYSVNVTQMQLQNLLGAVDRPLVLEIHHHIRENASELYGFTSRLEHDLFEFLLGAKGVGPKLALAILSHLGGENLLQAIRLEDQRSLTSVPGLGKKKAEYLLVELRDKCEKRFANHMKSTNRSAANRSESERAAPTNAGMVKDILLGLEGMGYKGAAVEAAVRSVVAAESETEAQANFSVLFKRALQAVTNSKSATPTATMMEV